MKLSPRGPRGRPPVRALWVAHNYWLVPHPFLWLLTRGSRGLARWLPGLSPGLARWLPGRFLVSLVGCQIVLWVSLVD